MRAEHQIERTRVGPICFTAVRTLYLSTSKGRTNGYDDNPDPVSAFGCLFLSPFLLQLVGTKPTVTLTTINQGIAEGILMPRIFPDQSIQNDRRIKPFDVVAFVNHPAPPGLAHVVGEFDAE